MSNTPKIYDWLMMAFSEPNNSLTETFYYDRRDKTFYSIHIMDYLVVKEDFTVNETVSSSYSIKTAKLLADRMQRSATKDPEIVCIPTLPLEERKGIMRQFANSLAKNNNLQNILSQKINNQDGTQRFDLYFGNEVDESTKNEWKKFKANSLYHKIDSFLNLNNIDIETSDIWDIGEKFSIDLKLNDEEMAKPSKNVILPKPWWKFW